MKKRAYYLNFVVAVLVSIWIFSTNSSAQLATGKNKFLGNTHSKGQTSINFDMYWNQLTPGNAGKWASCEQNRDDFNYWLWLDRAYDHAKQMKIPFKEHTLIWGAESGEPTWIRSVPQDEQMDEVIEWFDTLSKRYPDFEMIDVVNEPLHKPPSYKDAIGGDGTTGWDWVIWSFKKAREYFPNSILILNEYNILNYENECKNFLEIVKVLQEQKLIDAIGCQAHSLENITLNTIKKNMESLAATGLDIYISEYEVRGDDATQCTLYKEQFSYFWEHSSVKGVTLWGHVEGEMWRPEAYLLKTDGTERPALKWLKDEYFKYSTDGTKYKFETKAEGKGSVTLSPSGGVYDPFTNVTVTATADDGYEFHNWTGDKSGAENPAVFTMTSNRLLKAHFSGETTIKSLNKPSEYGQLKVHFNGYIIDLVLPHAIVSKINVGLETIIYDIQGNLVSKSTISADRLKSESYSIQLSRLSSGSYFMHVKIDGVVAQQSTVVVTR